MQDSDYQREDKLKRRKRIKKSEKAKQHSEFVKIKKSYLEGRTAKWIITDEYF